MKRTENRIAKLEAVRCESEGAPAPLPPVVMQAALAPAEGLPNANAQVSINGKPERSTRQFVELANAAFKLGNQVVGYQNDWSGYLDAAMPEMFAEPRSAAVQAMIRALYAPQSVLAAAEYDKLLFISVIPYFDPTGRCPDGY